MRAGIFNGASMKAKGTEKLGGANANQTIDHESGKPIATPRRIDLVTLRDIRLELGTVYRKMDSGEIQTQDGTRRAYVLKTIHDVIVSAELERRITELEQQRALPNGRPALPNAARPH